MTKLSALLQILGLSRRPVGPQHAAGDNDSLNLFLPLDGGKRILVGTLRQEANDFAFEYSTEFAQSGLPLLPDFRRTGELYRSPDLWPFFLARLPPIHRLDVQAEIARRNLESDDTLKLLGSLGRTAISSPYELEPAGA